MLRTLDVFPIVNAASHTLSIALSPAAPALDARLFMLRTVDVLPFVKATSHTLPIALGLGGSLVVQFALELGGHLLFARGPQTLDRALEMFDPTTSVTVLLPSNLAILEIESEVRATGLLENTLELFG